MRTPAASVGVWLTAAGAGVLAGAALQLQQPVLWPAWHYAAVAALASAAAGAALASAAAGAALASVGRGALPGAGRRTAARRAPGHLARRWAVWWAGWALLAFAVTGWRAGQRLADELPAALEGVDLVVVGVVDGLPQRAPGSWRFRFEVESARAGGTAVAVPSRLALGWYADAAGADLPGLRAGQRWQLGVRLKRPHGVLNPHGFDLELLLFEQGLRATGTVRSAPAAAHRLLGSGVGHRVDRLRQAVRDAIAARVVGADAGEGSGAVSGEAAAGGGPPGRREAGVLAALSVGDQAAIDRDDWALYRNTGVAHLMSISGLHVTMFAWLAARVAGACWRRGARLSLQCPAPRAASLCGLAAALAYAVFAGWGIPAQRTVLMLAIVVLLGAAGLRWRWPLVWGVALVAVVAVDPWALLQPGFWLSFAAVGLLMASSTVSSAASGTASRVPPGELPDVGVRARAGKPSRWRRAAGAVAGGVRTQVVATLGLAPLTLVFFQQLSLVGFAANLLAIPLVTLLVTPLALLGIVVPPLWRLAAWLVQGLNAALEAVAAPAWAVWSVPAAAPWCVAAALLASVLALLPLPWRVRALALPLVLPLLAPAVPRPAPGRFDLMAIDVGQGTAVLLRTATHALLYDTGPQYSRESDAGERVVVPLLRALGERRLDTLMLSHRDTDHVGGAAAVLQAVRVERLSSSLESGHRLRSLALQQGAAVVPCTAGQRWRWDGVDFELLHPDADALARAEASTVRPNTVSCVLRVSAAAEAGGRTALLTGDLEREQELALVARHGAALRSDVLVVPHHGSKTSSSAAFLDAVSPRVAVVQAGYRNRFGHPAPAVMARYAERGIDVFDSPRCGAWRLASDGTGSGENRCWRVTARRYWHHPDTPAPENGVEVAFPPAAAATDHAVP